MVTQRADLFQLVTDIEDRRALGFQLSQRLEQDLHLLRGQNAGWFIHNQKLGILQKTANDFNALPLTRRQSANRACRVKRQAVSFRHFADLARQITGRWRVFHAERHVFGHIQCVKQRKMLEYHRNTRRAGLAWLGRGKGLTAQFHRAFVGFHQAVDHFHQRGFARAVFAQKCVDFTRADVERHVVIGDNAGIGFGQA